MKKHAIFFCGLILLFFVLSSCDALDILRNTDLFNSESGATDSNSDTYETENTSEDNFPFESTVETDTGTTTSNTLETEHSEETTTESMTEESSDTESTDTICCESVTEENTDSEIPKEVEITASQYGLELSWDTICKNDYNTIYISGDSLPLNLTESPIDLDDGTWRTIILTGWVQPQNSQVICVSFGYSFNDGDIIRDGTPDSKAAYLDSNRSSKKGFFLTIPVENIVVNTNIKVYAFLDNGTSVQLFSFLVIAPQPLPDYSTQANVVGRDNGITLSWDSIFRNYVGNFGYPDGGAAQKISNNPLDLSIEDWDTMIVRGWAGSMDTENPIKSYAYRLNNAPIVVVNNSIHEAENPVIAAGGDSRFCLPIPLTEINQDTYIRVYAILTDGTPSEMFNFWVKANREIPDNTNNFTSDANSNTHEDLLLYSDLNDHFILNFPIGISPNSKIDKNGGNLYYTVDFISEMYTSPNGKYVFSVDIKEMSPLSGESTSGVFVRAIRQVKSTVSGIKNPINGFYEDDGDSGCGGSGIYFNIYNGKLTINIKTYTTQKTKRVKNNYFVYDITSDDITVVDSGNCLYVINDNKMITTIAFSERISYSDLDLEDPNIKFARYATIISPKGIFTLLENTLVVNSINSCLGLATRNGEIRFNSVSVAPYSSYTLPEYIKPSYPKESYVINFAEIAEKNVPVYLPSWTEEGYDEPVMKMGYATSINLGYIDLSQYNYCYISYSSSKNADLGGFGINSNTPCKIGLTTDGTWYGIPPAIHIGDTTLAYGDCINVPFGWAMGTRTMCLDISSVVYSGLLFVSHSQTEGNEIVISSIVFSNTPPET